MVTPNKELNTSNIKLSIQVSLNGLSFCALSIEENKIIFFRDLVFQKKLNPVQVLQQVEKIYEQELFLQKERPEVVVLYSNELYSLVPAQYFSEENASEYLKYNTKILETDYIAQDVLDEAGMVNVYIPYANLNNFFFEKHGEFEYRHCVSLLADELLKQNEGQNLVTKAYVNCYPGGYDLLVIKEGKLLLANSFKCKTKEDFIYYLLFTAEQLKLDTSQIELVLFGKITPESDYFKIAYRYIKNVSFLKTSFGYIFTGRQETPKGYMYFSLLKALK